MAEIPFSDINLENHILRQLLILDDVDTKADSNEVVKNINHAINVGISKDAFTSEFKQWIYETLIKCYVQHSDPVTKKILLKKMSQIYKDDFKTKETLLDRLFKYKLELHTFKFKADELKDLHNFRKLFQLNESLHEEVKSAYENDTRGTSLDLAQKVNDEVSKLLLEKSKFRLIEEDAFKNIDNDIQQLIDIREHPERYKGIPTGFQKIDDATGGWRKGELSIVLGRPGMGKSILLMNFGYSAYVARFNVVYITIEMPIEQQKRRLFSKITKISYSKLKQPERLDETELEYIKSKVKKIKSNYHNFYWIIDAPENCTASFIESRIIAFESATGQKVDLLIVDPIYLMQPSDKKAEDKVGTISWDLKILGRKLDIPVLAASQFNRESHSRHRHEKGTDTADAAFSDKLGNNCDNMMGITGDKFNARLSFPKTRDSNIQDVYLEKHFDIMTFIYNPKCDDDQRPTEGDSDD